MVNYAKLSPAVCCVACLDCIAMPRLCAAMPRYALMGCLREFSACLRQPKVDLNDRRNALGSVTSLRSADISQMLLALFVSRRLSADRDDQSKAVACPSDSLG